MRFNETEKEEREYLEKIISMIKGTLENTDISVKDHVDTLNEYKDYIWSNKDIDPHEIRSMRESILNHFALGENVIGKSNRLGKILDVPYFGRIDFREKNNESILPVYIGIHTFHDFKNKVNLIYDWRAPVCSMFYDYEPGEASYSSPAGEIKGNISLKRQYRIRKGVMEYMIESSLTIHDDILQKELSANADDKMKNIVATIQREQNRVIRNREAETLIIQGVPGSGKTSIALHRIAYLLYTMKGTVSSGDILIISPNKVFADYISNVLPELGEETIPGTGMEQILSAVLDDKYQYQDFFGQVTALLDKPGQAVIDRMKFKSSLDFLYLLDRFIIHVENHYFKAADVQMAKYKAIDPKFTKYVTITAEFIEKQFRRFNRYPVRQRFEVMADYIIEMVEIQYRFTVITAERNRLKKEIKKMFGGNQDLQLYRDFFEWIGKPEMFRMGKNRTLEYADLAPLAYLHLALDGNQNQSRIKHLLIDEMQDYTPVQYKVIEKLYPCRKTLLGDAGQSVNPYCSSTADMIRKVLGTGEVMKLCKSYRSTFEITGFAQQIRINKELEPVLRHGDPPQILKYKNAGEEIRGIADLVSAYHKSGYQSLAIICKTESLAKEMSENLKKTTDNIYLITHRSSAFVKGIMVISAHMAKGLEFDEVIIPQAGEGNYSSEIDRNMFYVAVTRAMHRLTITYSGNKSPFIP